MPSTSTSSSSQGRAGSVPSFSAQLGAYVTPDRNRIEVTARICLSLILSLVLTLGNFPRAVPPSQSVLIGSMAAAFTMILPTLMFSIGIMIFPGLVVGTIVALLFATALLAIAATAGRDVYVVAYFFMALLLSGLRFAPHGVGGMTAVLIMLMSLNTIGLSAVAEERGLDFVGSLWTEKGTQNPDAAFRNSIVGMCWVGVCLASARLVPPFRTARSVISRSLLPKILRDVGEFISATVDAHYADTKRNDDDEEAEEQPTSGAMDDTICAIVHSTTMVAQGNIATMTAFEPRLLRFGPAEWSVGILKRLALSVDAVVLSSLALRTFSRHDIDELKFDGLKELYEGAVGRLERCSTALANLQPLDTTSGKEGLDEGGDVEGNCSSRTQPPPFDPAFLAKRADRLEDATNAWIATMGPPDRSNLASYYSKSAREAMVKTLMPWVMGGGVSLIVAIFACFYHIFLPSTWRRILRPPYYDLPKAFWCLKFALGFTVLVCLSTYVPEFAQLEIAVADEGDPVQNAHFSGWVLIAYAFGTTQTVEGTWKKSSLRLMGTLLGAFSAWLALTACGTNPYGLGAWMAITGTIVAYLALPRGTKSRLGLDKDFAWGPAYFAMTQVIVVLEVYLGLGGKNDITVNRIVANCVGIGMAWLMAAIPPGIFGGSPRECLFLLEENKNALKACIEMVLKGKGAGSGTDLKETFERLHSTREDDFVRHYKEISDNYSDAKQLQRLCVLRLDPMMRRELDMMAVLGSGILTVLKMSAILAESPILCEFGEGGKHREDLEKILENLGGSSCKGTFYEDDKTAEGADVQSVDIHERSTLHAKSFVHYVRFVSQIVHHREKNLKEIKWGFFG